MTVKIKDSGLTPQDEIGLSRAMEAAQGRPGGSPWLTPDQYLGGGGDMMRQQAQFGAVRARKQAQSLSEEIRRLQLALIEREKLLAEAANVIDDLQDELEELRGNGETPGS